MAAKKKTSKSPPKELYVEPDNAWGDYSTRIEDFDDGVKVAVYEFVGFKTVKVSVTLE